MAGKNVSYLNKRVLVIGLGVSGKSAALFLKKQGAHVIGVDRDYTILEDSPEFDGLHAMGIECFSENCLLDIKSFNLVVVSPGVPKTHSLYQAALKAGIEVIGEIELAFRSLNKTILGVTGTNGKTTVTLLVEHVLNHWGKKAKALGNVGVPLTEALGEDDYEIAVVELSSFQLETLRSPVVDRGVILNITPDHLDRYSSFEEYAKAKIRMQSFLKEGGELYVEENILLNHKPLFLKEENIYTYGYSSHCDLWTDLSQVISKKNEGFILPKGLQGKASHDLENVLGAYALCRKVGISGEQFCQAFATFKKPPHRIQFVKTIRDVDYYDDSKGTNIDAVCRAIDYFSGKVILIAGGVDKGAPYTPWIAPFKDKVRYICAIGQAASKIKVDLEQNFPVQLFENMEAAVRFASKMAVAGDTVLLSPGCSSFDMFKSYAHRGEEFQRIVSVL